MTVKKATPKGLLLPKEKHVRKMIRGNTGKHPLAELFDALSKRMSTCKDSTSHLKCLYAIHRCMRESSTEFINQLKYRVHLLQLADTSAPSPFLGSQPLLFMRTYASYLKEKVEAYRALKMEVERNPEHCKSLPIDELIKSLPYLQSQLSALVALTKYTPLAQYSCPLILGCFELVLKDSFRLYSGYNIGVIQLLDHYFSLPLAQAHRALSIYMTFVDLTALTNEFFQSCHTFARDLPNLTTPSVELGESLEAYIIGKGGKVEKRPHKPSSASSVDGVSRSKPSSSSGASSSTSPKQTRVAPPPRHNVPGSTPISGGGSTPKLPGHLVRRGTNDSVVRGSTAAGPTSSTSSSSSTSPSSPPTAPTAQLLQIDLTAATPVFITPAAQISQVSQDEYVLQQQIEKERQEYHRAQHQISEDEARLQQQIEAHRLEQQRAHQQQLLQIQQQLQQQQQMLEQQLIEQQRSDRARLEEQIQLNKARLDQQRQEQERAHQLTLEHQRAEQQRIEQQKLLLEQQRVEQQKAMLEQQQRIEQQRLEQQRMQQEYLRQQQLLQMQQAQQSQQLFSFASQPASPTMIVASPASPPTSPPLSFSSSPQLPFPSGFTSSTGFSPSVGFASPPSAFSSSLPSPTFAAPPAAPPAQMPDLFSSFSAFPMESPASPLGTYSPPARI